MCSNNWRYYSFSVHIIPARAQLCTPTTLFLHIPNQVRILNGTVVVSICFYDKTSRVDLFILVYFGSGFQFMATWFCHFWVRVWWGRVSQKCWTVPQGKAVHFRIARKQKTNKQTKASKSSTRESLEPFYIWTIRLAFQLKYRYLLAVLYLPIWIWSIKWVFVFFSFGGVVWWWWCSVSWSYGLNQEPCTWLATTLSLSCNSQP